ncbi:MULTISPECIES: MFS transporter [unclassified Rhizobium]|jgi:MFS family permease|uniref:MFS transporter n=1 Tax=unclassified Rhizobium TaxID=2613769 RepID=UPI0006488C2D|nr:MULTISPECIES: MFS transporter [unclassified Rhizobium]MBN8954219.1 MFS transporter [Rhizobium tropici]OJY70890.1 MAG: MFS transporter [Rhizobium sp. 60-20]RKD50753.1 putative MFS family arabinose efflux permease [Rhizobium sp. WW_1]
MNTAQNAPLDQSLGKRNAWILTVAQAFGGANAPIVISLGGLVGQHLSPDPDLITLPVSLLNLGLALGTLPAAYVMRRLGRRNGYLIGTTIGMISGLVAAIGIILSSFVVFCLGTCMAGLYSSYVQSYRFAAADNAPGSEAQKAIARVMVGGLVAAVIGPQLVIWTRDAVPGTAFAGSFISQGLLAALAFPVLWNLRAFSVTKAQGTAAAAERPLMQILTSPRYLLAIATGVVSYGLMTFVMTASPVAMVGHGHSIDQAALGIQWHILAMYGPSFITGRLMVRFGKERVAAVGLLLIASAAAVALSGFDIGHFWVALVLLGIGWNFGFIGATSMVGDCHTTAERSKVQGANDFLVFGTVACASFFSGSLLHSSGWETINWIVLPACALVLVPLVWRTYWP